MTIEIKIEIRSRVAKNENLPSVGKTHNFIVFVKGPNGNRIDHFVKQVVYYLPSDFPNPKLIRNGLPYLISGSTNASFRLSIEIFLHTSEKLNKVSYSYYLLVPDTPVENSICMKTLTFVNCPGDFRERLLLGGGEVIDPEKKFGAYVDQIKTEPVENANGGKEINNHLLVSHVHNGNASEQNTSFNIQDVFSFDDLVKENGILKMENEIMNKKLSDQESEIVKHLKKLPDLKTKSSVRLTELNQLKIKLEATGTEISSLKSAIQKLQSEILQHKNKAIEDKRRMEWPGVSPILVNTNNFENLLKI